MGDPKVVNIKLDTDQNTRALEESELIHPREFKTVIKLLEDSLKKIKNEIDECWENEQNTRESESRGRIRVHDTIVISGARGTGKTTFILSLLKKIKTSVNLFNEPKEVGRCGILVIDIIDPTLVEEKAHLLVNIISRIYDAVSTQYFCRYSFEDSEIRRQYETWESCFDELAEGLPSIDGIGTNNMVSSDWDDPKYIIREGVRKAKASNNLEINLHKFIELSLSILKKRAVLICFDDIDTNFTKGWPVLEVLRKYLTSPRIITILSGDLELYSAIVRKSQWDNIGIDRVKGETYDSLNKFKDLVSLLENQYLLKILRPERRVTLNSIFSNITQYNVDYKIDDIDIRNYYQSKLFEKYSFKSKDEIGIIIGFVENLPIRTQIQLLLALNEEEAKKSRAIFNVFWNNWNEWNSNNSVIFEQPEVFPRVVIRFLLENNLIEEGYLLLPDNSNFSKSASLFVAGLYYQALIKRRPFYIFEYLIRIGLTHEVHEILDHETVEEETDYFKIFVEHCKLESQSKLKIITGRYNSIGFTTSKSSKKNTVFEPLGNIELNALFLSRRNQRHKRIDTVLMDSRSKLNSMIGLLPLTVVSDNRGYSTPQYSIYNLIAIIGELLKIEEPDEEDIRSFLERSSLIMSFPKVGTLDFNLDDDQSGEPLENESDNLPEALNPEWGEFIKYLMGWLKEAPPSPSPYLLANISSRFYNNLRDLKEHAFVNVGSWISFVTCTFLNSVIIEEYFWSEEKTTIDDIRLTNIVKSYRYFLDNLKVVKDYSSEFTFSLWLLKCPLLQIFIDYDSLMNSNKWLDISSIVIPSIPLGLNQVLNTVPIKTKRVNFNQRNKSHIKRLVDFCKSNQYSSISIQKLSAKDISDLIMQAFDDNADVPTGISSEVKRILKEQLS